MEWGGGGERSENSARWVTAEPGGGEKGAIVSTLWAFYWSWEGWKARALARGRRAADGWVCSVGGERRFMKVQKEFREVW